MFAWERPSNDSGLRAVAYTMHPLEANASHLPMDPEQFNSGLKLVYKETDIQRKTNATLGAARDKDHNLAVV